MTKLYGFTTISEYHHVIGFGKWCLVWGIYVAKVPKRRLRWMCYTTKSYNVVYHIKLNNDRFRFFGYISIDKENF